MVNGPKALVGHHRLECLLCPPATALGLLGAFSRLGGAAHQATADHPSDGGRCGLRWVFRSGEDRFSVSRRWGSGVGSCQGGNSHDSEDRG